MRDPHVSALVYRLETDDTVAFDDPPPLEWETDAFRMRLTDGVLRFEMKEHHASEQRARGRVEPHIRSWELWNALDLGRRAIRFVFEKPEIVDRDPPAPGKLGVVKEIDTAESLLIGIAPTAHVTDRRRRYPEPPTGFVASPDVEMMWNRYNGYRAGREPLAGMAYMCLTVLQASAGGREEAAKQYGVDVAVLKKLGQLVSEIGDPQTARKVPKRGFRPHTDAEKVWIEAVVKAVIRRVGEWAADPNADRPRLTMADFPTLK